MNRGASRKAQRATLGLVILAGALAAACSEKLTAPGQCPDYCPDRLTVRDTVLRAPLGRDTAFRGYWLAREAPVLVVADLPNVRSRALVRTLALLPPTYRLGTDTTDHPIIIDSLILAIRIVRRDTAAHNLRLHLYRIPKDFDSLTVTYADVDPSFTDSLVRSVNVDSLIALPGRRDPTTGDSVQVTDTTTNSALLLLKLDSAQARYGPADSGRLAYGLAVTADSLASATLGSSRLGTGLLATWYARVDSAGVVDTFKRPPQPEGTEFDTFVFDPPAAPLDSTLAVGGMPTSRSILRVALPPGIRDSAQIIRATLLLVPDRAAEGVPADSFLLAARRVQSDLGAKSVLAEARFVGDSTHIALAWMRIGSTDTVSIEVTRILRTWVADTTLATVFMLQQFTRTPLGLFEGASLAEVRFKPSSDAAFRPALHITYAPRFRFEVP